MKYQKILILFPTWSEARPFMLRCGSLAEVWRCGIGSIECAVRSAEIIEKRRPDILILAGIAGAFPDRGLKKGMTVLVGCENIADLGTLRDGQFHVLASDGSDPQSNRLHNPTRLPEIFEIVESDTVSTAGTPYRNHASQAKIENMEGAGFFAVCNRMGIDYAELRTISNYVGEDRSSWIFSEAAEILCESLCRFITALRQTN